mmetsp:Transcript_17901/g.20677  ORF Transcript_17901/g.20677 Transcript_17901/m.20677 type:complete len:114 (+) Transcript_17901:41-382(+)
MESNDRATRLSLGGVTQNTFSGNSNVKSFIKTVEGMIDEGKGLMREYKREIELLKSDISLMEKKIDTINQTQNLNTIIPIIRSDLSSLGQAIDLQKEENNNLQKQLTTLKKEK